jgi:hypothetical protein
VRCHTLHTHCHCRQSLYPSRLTTNSCQHMLPLSPWPPPLSTHNAIVSTHAVLQPNAVNGKLAKNGGPRRKSATSKVQAGSRSRARSAAATHAAEHDPRDDRAVLLVECTVPSRVYFTFSAYVVLAPFSDTLVFAPEGVKGWQCPPPPPHTHTYIHTFSLLPPPPSPPSRHRHCHCQVRFQRALLRRG